METPVPKALMSRMMQDQWLAPYLYKLSDYGLEIVISEADPPLAGGDWLPDLEGTAAIFANGNDDVTAEVIDAAPDLKVICRTGVGFDRVDTDAAALQRVPVTNTPGSNSEAVADFAMGMIIACARRIPRLNGSLKAGAWQPSLGADVHSKTLGIAGLGPHRPGRGAAGARLQHESPRSRSNRSTGASRPARNRESLPGNPALGIRLHHAAHAILARNRRIHRPARAEGDAAYGIPDKHGPRPPWLTSRRSSKLSAKDKSQEPDWTFSLTSHARTRRLPDPTT